MTQQEYIQKLSKVAELSGGTHRMLPQFYKHTSKPFIIGYWAEKLDHILTTLTPPELPSPIPDNNKEPEEVIIRDTDPDEIIDLKQQAKNLHKEESYLHFALTRSISKAKRYDLAFRIQTIVGPQLDKIYDQIREYNSTGSIPVVIKKINKVEDVRSIINKVNTVKSRISRLKKLIAENEGETRLKYEKELSTKQILLTELQSKL